MPNDVELAAALSDARKPIVAITVTQTPKFAEGIAAVGAFFIADFSVVLINQMIVSAGVTHQFAAAVKGRCLRAARRIDFAVAARGYRSAAGDRGAGR